MNQTERFERRKRFPEGREVTGDDFRSSLRTTSRNYETVSKVRGKIRLTNGSHGNFLVSVTFHMDHVQLFLAEDLDSVR